MTQKHILFTLLTAGHLLLSAGATRADNLDWAGDAKNNAGNGFLATCRN